MTEKRGYFITGTDTGVGKTWCTVALMAYLQQRGYRVLGMKPVASGCERIDGAWCNDDALRIRAQGSTPVDYALINPYAFAPPIAPHLAAAQADCRIDLAALDQCFARLHEQADLVVVEGAGGWRVPLNARYEMADLARHLALPVILVVGLRLGCINHALLSAQAITASGCPLAGWVANPLDPSMACVAENIDSIGARIGAPLLGVLPHLPALDAAHLAEYLQLV